MEKEECKHSSFLICCQSACTQQAVRDGAEGQRNDDAEVRVQRTEPADEPAGGAGNVQRSEHVDRDGQLCVRCVREPDERNAVRVQL